MRVVPDVSFERALVLEAAAALAAVEHAPRVGLHVPAQTRSVQKHLPAMRARVQHHGGAVRARVRGQRAALRERLGALRARERTLLSMYKLVALHDLLLRKGASALRAREGPRAAVRPLVAPQRAATGETLVADAALSVFFFL